METDYQELSHELAAAKEMLSFDDDENSQKAAIRKMAWLAGAEAVVEGAIESGAPAKKELMTKAAEMKRIFWDDQEWVAAMQARIESLGDITHEVPVPTDNAPDFGW